MCWLRLILMTLMLNTTLALTACGQASTTQAPTAVPTTPPPTPTLTKTPRPTRTPQPTATVTPTPLPPPQASIQVETLNVREGPGSAYPVLAQVPAGETLLVTGRANDSPWVKVQFADQSEAWISAQPEYTQLSVDLAMLPVAYFRSPSITFYRADDSTGQGELNIDNKGDVDGVIILMQGDTMVLASYVRAGENLAIESVPDGEFAVFFTSGTDWDGLQFTSDRQNERFEEPLQFATTDTTYSIWNLSLSVLPGLGNSDTSPVDENEMPLIPPDTEGA